MDSPHATLRAACEALATAASTGADRWTLQHLADEVEAQLERVHASECRLCRGAGERETQHGAIECFDCEGAGYRWLDLHDHDTHVRREQERTERAQAVAS